MLGMIFMVPWNWAPYNYQLCQGQTVTLQQYEALYSLMGTVFGGNGSTNFNLPNLAGRAPIGTGAMPPYSYTLGANGGSVATTLSGQNLPAHNHGATFIPTMGQQVVSIPATTGNLGVGVTINATGNAGTKATPQTGFNQLGQVSTGTGAPSPSALLYAAPAGTQVPLAGVSASLTGTAGSGAATVTINAVTGGTVVTGPAGSGTAFSNMQPYLALSFVIAMNGLYPDRP
ncbi:hypothetical protein VY88_28645 [Azospirillum thiophilum]|uniref:phage tail protein n=1 Tax=Azospirillum thiophilum TaxID=528244 RepID=UPI00061FBDDA|nr:tail fiber protein [Azospirillum thiophilum]KJR62083.1 hypothetical protein VY88_28645 [Azospirillum thiophilum]